MEIRKPSRPIRSGDRIALVRPGLAGVFPEWPVVLDRLEKKGIVPILPGTPPSGAPLFPFAPYYADDRTRARDIWASLRNPDYAGVMAYRGGSGAIRLLGEWRDPGSPVGHVPVVCGFSDMTYLHAHLARTMNMVTFWGPNARELSNPGSFDLWWEAVSGGLGKGDALPLGEARSLCPGKATGPLWGGNLESLAHLSGTPHLPDLKGRILLLEDIDEPLYAIDRALRTLFLSGILGQAQAIVLGPFSRTGTREDDPAQTVFDLLKPLTGSLPVISASLPGHGDPMATWPLGVRVELSSPASGPPEIRLLESPFSK
jgi:muramoyltetrapeptide carboxypeptidase